MIVGTIRAIEHDAPSAQIERVDTGAAKRLVTHCAIGHTRGLADLIGCDRAHRLGEALFNRELQLIGEFFAIGVEEFHAIVEIRIVRCGDDEARARAEFTPRARSARDHD